MRSLTCTALANGHRLRPMTARSSQRRVAAIGSSSIPMAAGRSVAEVVELQRQLELGALEQRDRGLQVVALLAVDAQLVAVDLAVDLELGVLQRRLDLLGELALDALLDRNERRVGTA